MCIKVTSLTPDEPINLQVFQERFFREAIRSYIREYRNHFGDRLASIYVWGSVHRNEAVPGVSDLDLHSFIIDKFTESDLRWHNEAGERLEEKFPGTHGLDRSRSVDEVWQVAVRLCYDATLIWGQDLTKRLDVPFPDRSSIRGAFQSILDLTRYAVGLESENKTDFSLPDEPALRLRKLARLGVFSGGYLLKAQGKCRSSEGAKVLPKLKHSYPQWVSFLDKTQALYIYLTEPTNEEVSEYLSELVNWMDWVNEHL